MKKQESVALLYALAVCGEDSELRMAFKGRLPHRSLRNVNAFASQESDGDGMSLSLGGLDRMEALGSMGEDELVEAFKKMAKEQSKDMAKADPDRDERLFHFSFNHADGVLSFFDLDFENFLVEAKAEKTKFTVPVFESWENEKPKRVNLEFYIENGEGERMGLADLVEKWDQAAKDFPSLREKAQKAKEVQEMERENQAARMRLSKRLDAMSPQQMKAALEAIDKALIVAPPKKGLK